MMIYNIINELNRTYMTLPADTAGYDDYRYRMLTDNAIEGILPVEIRTINGERRFYYDISEKENLIRTVSVKDIDFEELEKLTRSMMMVSSKLREYLLEESCIVFEPDLIFRDTKSGRYEFICVPGKDEEEKREDIKRLLQTVISHVAPSDERAVEAAYEIYEMAEAGPVLSRSLYERVAEKMKREATYIYEPVEEEDDLPEEEYEDIERPVYRYRPSFREWLGIACAAMGFICIGLYTYYGVLS
ncbi:MAG: DUF6382 domain-containing protein [Lachnospiraceae bacterium]|nr:DUF6382 domain-containing protein [Lachnospiraceae bacterium]